MPERVNLSTLTPEFRARSRVDWGSGSVSCSGGAQLQSRGRALRYNLEAASETEGRGAVGCSARRRLGRNAEAAVAARVVENSRRFMRGSLFITFVARRWHLCIVGA